VTKAKDIVSIDFVKSALAYDPESGVMKWKFRPNYRKNWNTRFAGKPAGTLEADDHIYIGLAGRRFVAHRLAWAIMTGEWPHGEIDHRNEIKSDNRWDNLRQATTPENRQNKRAPRTNTSGYKGVCYCRLTGRWVAQIQVESNHKYLGRYNTPEEAYAVYQEAALRLHGEFANTKPKGE
jgi:HNH endonuclease/AP2 domain